MNTATLPPRLSPASASPDRAFASWGRATAAAAYFLLFAGGMVTSTGSGLAVPDWPLSFGTLNPPMVGGVFFEHGHRLIAGAVAMMTLGLLILSTRPAVPAPARLCARLASGAVLIQAALGGLTVLLRLPPAVSIAHACLGQATFCLLLAAAVLGGAAPRAPRAATYRFAVLGFSAAFLQLALGALVRHTGAALPHHFLWAAAVLSLAALAAWSARPAPALRGPALVLALTLPAQIALGLLALRLKTDSVFIMGFRESALWRTAHLSGGALILGAFLVLALRARPEASPR